MKQFDPCNYDPKDFSLYYLFEDKKINVSNFVRPWTDNACTVFCGSEYPNIGETISMLSNVVVAQELNMKANGRYLNSDEVARFVSFHDSHLLTTDTAYPCLLIGLKEMPSHISSFKTTDDISRWLHNLAACLVVKRRSEEDRLIHESVNPYYIKLKKVREGLERIRTSFGLGNLIFRSSGDIYVRDDDDTEHKITEDELDHLLKEQKLVSEFIEDRIRIYKSKQGAKLHEYDESSNV